LPFFNMSQLRKQDDPFCRGGRDSGRTLGVRRLSHRVAEAFRLSFNPRNAEGAIGKVENVTFSNIRSTAEGGIVIWGEQPGDIRNLTLRDFDLHLVRGDNVTAYGGNFDLRGRPDRQNPHFKHDIPGIYAQRVDGLRLTNMRIIHDPDLPDFYTGPTEFKEVTGFVRRDFEAIGFGGQNKQTGEATSNKETEQ
jgi:hypothetical protein